jgi:hypothetical protein
MHLTISSFFRTYINHPLSNDLSVQDRVKAAISSIAIGILTLGIAQLVCSRLSQVRVQKIIAAQKEKAVAMARLSMPPIYGLAKVAPPDALPCGELRFGTVSGYIQSLLINPCYAQPLPKADAVVVPLPGGGKARWMSLTPEEKIEVNNHHTHPHNQVQKTAWGRKFIDSIFMPGSQAPFLRYDPREHHGSDHAARIAIFVCVFAYLYAKYHPSVEYVTPNDIVLSQFIGAGHDSKRETEGPDVYDEESAQATVEALKSAGVNDERVFTQVRSAIAEKDSPPSDEKPLIARLVQNADCAEFARLLLPGPVQEIDSFQKSVRYLDIYKELSSYAEKNKGMLKGGLSISQFKEELEVLRWEMNRLIYETHEKSFRRKASMPGVNYLDAIVQVINAQKYPLLNRILEEMGVKMVY